MADLNSLYGGYLAKSQMNRQEEAQNLQSMGALQGLLMKQQAMEEQRRLASLVSQSGGDANATIKKLLSVGTPQAIELASKLKGMVPDPSQAALRNAQAEKATLESKAMRDKSNAIGQYGEMFDPTKNTWAQPGMPLQVMPNEAAAQAAAIEHMQKYAHLPEEQRPVFRATSPDQGRLQELLMKIDPAAKVRADATAMNRPPERPQIVGPGAALVDRGGKVIVDRPFAPPAPGAPVVVMTPDGPRYTTRNDAIGAAPPPPASATKDPRAQAAYNAGLKEVQKDEAATQATAQLENAFNRWRELNAQVTTGRAAGYRPAIMQPMLQELQQLQNYLAVNNFKPGQGQISNFERQLIKGAGPSVLNDKETNDRIIDVQLGAVANIRDRAEFRQWYLENKGSLLGSAAAWNEYLEKNPRFTKGKKEGSIVPNENRVGWSDYFGVGSPAQPAAPVANNEIPTFATEAEASKANLQDGQEVIIGGRKARYKK